MPRMELSIGGRKFSVMCQDGEEPVLQAAAKLLDNEAQSIGAHQDSAMPDVQMMMMSGLLLADKIMAMQEKEQQNRKEIKALKDQVNALEAAVKNGAGGNTADDTQVLALTKDLEELCDTTEKLAEKLAEKS